MLAAAVGRRRTDRRTFSSWPVPWGDIALMGARAARAGVMLRQIDPSQGNGVVLALGTEGDDGLARLRAGEATSLVLLSATAMGLATCPVTEALETPETREAVRADVFGTSGHPQLLMRVGWAPVDADSLPATPHRGLATRSTPRCPGSAS
jgi:nitroreductase